MTAGDSLVPLQLTTQHLDYLVAVDEHPTWAEAAASRGVSASALSQGLSELERRIGVPLFERSGRRRLLTSNATHVLSYAKRVVASTHELSRWAHALRLGEAGELRVGMIDVAAVAYFPNQLRHFRTMNPDVEVHLTVAGSRSLVERLQAATLDVAIIVAPPQPLDGIDTVPLRTERLGVYAPPDANVGAPTMWGPWVTFPMDSHSRSHIERYVSSLGGVFNVVAESHQPDVLVEMVHLGLGWTVLPVIQAEKPDSLLQRVDVSDPLERHLVIARRTGAVGHPAAENLSHILQSER